MEKGEVNVGRYQGGKLRQQVTFDLKSAGRLAVERWKGEERIAVDLNGEVPRGPLDAFFMSCPRYTEAAANAMPHRPSLGNIVLLSGKGIVLYNVYPANLTSPVKLLSRALRG